MTEANWTNSLDRNADLVVAGIYERQIGASLERVWENVYDWEHLPYLHSEAFTSISLVDSGDWGWRARVGMTGGTEATIELITNRAAHHYVARTIKGAGAPSEIWTSLDPSAPDQTGIRVEFCVEPMPEKALRKLGKGFVGLYTLLWSQDEAMMQTRTAALVARGTGEKSRRNGGQSGRSAETISLGTVDEVRSRLPLIIELSGHSFRIVETDGAFIAHSTECPHLFGPLGDCTIEGGKLVCPWHGYEFDLRSGRSTEGRPLRLRPAPKIEIDSAQRVVVASLMGGLSRVSDVSEVSEESKSEDRHGSP
jgi:nitrite reductase/ring-hydroxylating ferredoxin subunit